MTNALSTESLGEFPILEVNETSKGRSDTTITIVGEAADFAALRGEWGELLSSSASDCLFLTWEWLYAWWNHLHCGKRLFIVTVRSGSKLIAIAPLAMTRAWVGPLSVPVLEFAGTGSIGSDYLDLIVRRGYETAALTALTNFLADTGFSMRLTRVIQTSAGATALSRGLAGRGWDCVEVPMDGCPFIDLSVESWDSYLSSVHHKHRSNFRRSLRNLHKDYAVDLQWAESEEDRRTALKHLVNLHLLRWQRRGGSDAFYNANLLAFHDELSRLAVERGWLRLLVLILDGAAAAAFYGFRYGRTFHFYQSGFNPAFGRYSVGLVTIGLTIRKAIEEGAAEYDLLHGQEAYKFLWATQVRRLVRLELYPPKRLGRMHRKTAQVAAAARSLAARWVNVIS